jgi:hypothetical protein
MGPGFGRALLWKRMNCRRNGAQDGVAQTFRRRLGLGLGFRTF